MSFLSKTLGDIVQSFLEKSSPLRDDDKRLLLNVWAKQLGRSLTEQERELFKEIASSRNCVAPESVSRARRAIQGVRPELRGELYQERQEKAQEVAKEAAQGSLFNN